MGKPWQVRQTTLEVDLALLKKNYYSLLKRAPKAELIVLLKCDAYGHSHKEVSVALSQLPSDARLHGFGVANVEEGIELRREGIKKPIYVLSGIQSYNEDIHRCLVTCDLIPVISSLSVLRQLCRCVKGNGSQTLHLKFNTGMNRLGIDMQEMQECIALLQAHPEVQVQGLMSHFASAEKKQSALTKKQVKVFREIVGAFKANGLFPKFLHMENSAGLAQHHFPEGNISRVGIHLYGIGDKQVQPIVKWTAQVYQVRNVKKGEPVGYGPLFRAKKNMKMAVLGVGYGDGYRRSFSNKADVLIQGKRCRVIGAISMDLTAVDVSSIPGVEPGDRAILLGGDGKNKISAEELALYAKTIPYEIMTSISARVPRMFVNGK